VGPQSRLGADRAAGGIGSGVKDSTAGSPALIRSIEGSFEIAGYEPGVEAVYRSDSSYFSGHITFRVEAAGEGAKLIIHVKGEMKGLFRLLKPLLGRSAPRQRERMKEIMKGRLEAQGTDSQGSDEG